MKQQPPSPLKRLWDLVSLLLGVMGLASLADTFITWVGFLADALEFYRHYFRPLVAWLPRLLNWSPYFADYLFIGAVVISSILRPELIRMKPHWRPAIPPQKWFAFWAPHRVAIFLLSLILLPFWPLFFWLHHVADMPGWETETVEDRRNLKHAKQQWLVLYVLCFTLMVGINHLLSMSLGFN